MVVERSELKDKLMRLLDYGIGAQRPANGRAAAPSAVVTPAESVESPA